MLIFNFSVQIISRESGWLNSHELDLDLELGHGLGEARG